MILLKDIIDEFMLSATDPDSFVYGCSRTLVLKHAKRSFETIMYAASPDVRILQQKIPSHKTLSWPIGAIDVLRISVVDADGRTMPVYENKRNPIAFEYVKDSEGKIILDGTGKPLKASIDVTPADVDYDRVARGYDYNYFYGARFGIRGGENNGVGTFRYESETKLFHFFDFPEDTPIIFEYMVNPLVDKPEDEVSISEFAREPLNSFIYYELIKWKANVAQAEKERARREYYHLLSKAKKRILMNAQSIAQSMKKARAFLSW